MNSKRIFSIAALLSVIIVAGCSNKLETPDPKDKGDLGSGLVWNFPVISDIPGWDTLKTVEERLQLLNMPEEILKSISTDELVEICMAYPQWGLIHAYNDRRTGMAVLMRNFNGFQELFERDDAATELLKAYDRLDPLAINPDWTLLEVGTYSAQFEKMEMFLSSRPMIDKLDRAGIQQLTETVISKYGKKKELPEVFSLRELSTTVAVGVNILEKENPEALTKRRNEINTFMYSFISEDSRFLDDIVELLKRARI